MHDHESTDLEGAARLAEGHEGLPPMSLYDFNQATPVEREAIAVARSIGNTLDLEDRLRLAMRVNVTDASPHDLRTLAGRALVLARRRDAPFNPRGRTVMDVVDEPGFPPIRSAPERRDAPSSVPGLITRYFTFGFDHAHAHAGRTYDKDIVVKITAPVPRLVMLDTFGQDWSMEYDSLEKVGLHHYPRGVVEL